MLLSVFQKLDRFAATFLAQSFQTFMMNLGAEGEVIDNQMD